MTSVSNIEDRFRARFGKIMPRVFRAPGRVNLIGEHTDYNDGFAMPAAIEFYCWVAVGERKDPQAVDLFARIFGERGNRFFNELDFADEIVERLSDWRRVGIREVGHAAARCESIDRERSADGSGARLVSAAIEVATALALSESSGVHPDRLQLARLCRAAENEFVGARVGIMDQFVSLHGEKNHALLLDCRSLTFEPLSIPDWVKLVICNTMVKHELASSEYNRRRADCEEAVRRLATVLPGIKALRDVSLEQL